MAGVSTRGRAQLMPPDGQPRARVRLLGRIGIALSFVLLFCGVAAHAYESGFVQRIAARCGSPCSATPAFDYLALALCGAAAILCVALYARFTGTLQRVLVDPVKYVRPEPAPDKVPG